MTIAIRSTISFKTRYNRLNHYCYTISAWAVRAKLNAQHLTCTVLVNGKKNAQCGKHVLTCQLVAGEREFIEHRKPPYIWRDGTFTIAKHADRSSTGIII